MLLFQVLITTLESHTAMIWAARTPRAITTLLVQRVHETIDQQGNPIQTTGSGLPSKVKSQGYSSVGVNEEGHRRELSQ